MRTRLTGAVLLAALLLAGCGPQGKLERLRRQSLAAQMVIADEKELPEIAMGGEPRRDTMVVEDPDGNAVLIMRAVKDENGEMVATDVLQAAKVTARFRNVAERSGKVDLNFRIIVPEAMQDREWQLRFYPDLFVAEDSLRLDPILITGEGYRKAQLKGYEHYRRFLDSIAADSTHFVDRFQLEMFLRRNLPDIYRYKTDSTAVSEEEFRSHYGITEQQALAHYTNQLVVRRNRRKVSRKDDMFRKYVKVPIVTEGLRLDTVIVSPDGDILYDYVQSIHVRPSLRKATVLLSGDIFEEDRRIYRVPRTEPLTFYITRPTRPATSTSSRAAPRSGRRPATTGRRWPASRETCGASCSTGTSTWTPSSSRPPVRRRDRSSTTGNCPCGGRKASRTTSRPSSGTGATPSAGAASTSAWTIRTGRRRRRRSGCSPGTIRRTGRCWTRSCGKTAT